MPIVDLPNGETAEFPDSMSREEIKGVLNKRFGAPSAPSSFKDTLMKMIQGQAGAFNKPGSSRDSFRRALERSAAEGSLNLINPAWNFFNKL